LSRKLKRGIKISEGSQPSQKGSPEVNIPVTHIKILTEYSLREGNYPNLEELAQSIHERGLLHPITITPVNINNKPMYFDKEHTKYFGVVIGEGRYLAMTKILGYTHLTLNDQCRFKEYDSIDDMLLDMITENIQRENVPFMAMKRVLRPLLKKFGSKSLCKKLGKSEQWLKNMNLISKKVAPGIQDKVVTTTKKGSLPEGSITQKTAIVLGQNFPADKTVPHSQRQKNVETQEKIVETVTKEKLSTSTATKVIKAVKKDPEKPLKKIVEDVEEEEVFSKSLKRELEGKTRIGSYYVMNISEGNVSLFNVVTKNMSIIQLNKSQFHCMQHNQVNCLCVQSVKTLQKENKINIESYIIDDTQPEPIKVTPTSPSVEEPSPAPPEPKVEPEPEDDSEVIPIAEPIAIGEPESPPPSTSNYPTTDTSLTLDSKSDTDDEEAFPITEPPAILENPPQKPKHRQKTLTEFQVKVKVEEPIADKLEMYRKENKLDTVDDAVTSIVTKFFDEEPFL
jgi:ParB-like chromosome segregation protein Spo0J